MTTLKNYSIILCKNEHTSFGSGLKETSYEADLRDISLFNIEAKDSEEAIKKYILTFKNNQIGSFFHRFINWGMGKEFNKLRDEWKQIKNDNLATQENLNEMKFLKDNLQRIYEILEDINGIWLFRVIEYKCTQEGTFLL